jgi:membrane protein DedA with SNARE-associated domain
MTTTALYWYASIFAWLFFTGIGIPPCPEEAGILYAAGVGALHPEVWWALAWASCGLGIVAADSVLYGVGRKWGARLFKYRWVQKVISDERRLRLEGHFAKHGMKMLLMARFLPPLRTGVFLIAGAARYSYVKFLVADLIYAVVGVGAFFFCGAWIVELLSRFESTAIFVVALAVMLYGLYMYYKLLRRREYANYPVPPVSVLQGPEGTAPAGEPTTNASAAPAAKHEAKVALEGS